MHPIPLPHAHPDEITPADLFMQVDLWLTIDWGL